MNQEVVDLLDRSIYTSESFDILRDAVENILADQGVDILKLNNTVKVFRSDKQDMMGFTGFHQPDSDNLVNIYIQEGLKGREIISVLFHEYGHEINPLGSFRDNKVFSDIINFGKTYYFRKILLEAIAYTVERQLSKEFEKEYNISVFNGGYYIYPWSFSDIFKIIKFIQTTGHLPAIHFCGIKTNMGVLARVVKSKYKKEI